MDEARLVRRRTHRSCVWDAFTSSDDRETATCNICQRCVTTHRGTTSGMQKHLAAMHTVRIGLVDDDLPRNPVSVSRVKKDRDMDLYSPHSTKINESLESAELEYAEDINNSVPDTSVRKFPKRRQLRSLVWKYFSSALDRSYATCNFCSRAIKITHGTTSGLMKHLKAHHKPMVVGTNDQESATMQPVSFSSEDDEEVDSESECDAKNIHQDVPRQSHNDAYAVGDGAEQNLMSFVEVEMQQSPLGEKATEETEKSISDRTRHTPELTKRRFVPGIPLRKSRRKFRSFVWKYFIPSVSRLTARCKICEMEIRTAQGSTGGLHKHLQFRHRGMVESKDQSLELPSNPLPDESSEDEKDSKEYIRNIPGPSHSHSSLATKFRRRLRSNAWHYFVPATNRKSANCKICDLSISTAGGSTSGMKHHLYDRHNIKMQLCEKVNFLESERREFMKRPQIHWRNKRRIKSVVWRWFMRDPALKIGTCKLCEAKIKIAGGSTSGLMRHMMSRHNGELKKLKGKQRPIGHQICRRDENMEDYAHVSMEDNHDYDNGMDNSPSSQHYEDHQLSQCFLCCSTFNDTQSSTLASSISKQLHVIFLLRNVLKIPKAMLHHFLKKYGNPEGWIHLCHLCDTRLNQAKTIYKELLVASQKFRDVRKEIIQEVQESVQNVPVFRSSCPDAAAVITENCLNYIRGCGMENFIDPFIAGDLEATRQINIARAVIKMEPDELEVFIPPEDFIKMETDSNFGDNQIEDNDYHEDDFAHDKEIGGFGDTASDHELGTDEKKELRPSSQNQQRQDVRADNHFDKYIPDDREGEKFPSDSDNDPDFAVEKESDNSIKYRYTKTITKPILKSKVQKVPSRIFKKKKMKFKLRPGIPVINCPLCKAFRFRIQRGDVLCKHLDECPKLREECLNRSLLRCPMCAKFKATIADKVRFAEHMGACPGSRHTEILIPLSKRLFSCDICPDQKYLTFDQFISHWLFHKKNVYKCTICEKVRFQSCDLTTEHVAKEHAGDPRITSESPGWMLCGPSIPTIEWPCYYCNETFPSDDARDDHVRENHPDRVAFPCSKCDWCPKEFAFADELTLHSATVHAAVRNICDVCNLHFVRELDLKTHRMEMHGLKFLYRCHLCDAEMTTSASLKQHMLFHSEARHKDRTCPICHKVCLNAACVERHIRLKHKNDSRSICNEEGCGKVCRSEDQLATHKASVHNIGNFRCEVSDCDRVFYRRYLLDQHIARVHTKEFKYTCSVCAKGFYNRTSWNRHEQYNHAPPSFICDICGKAFKTSSNLKQHQQFHKPKPTDEVSQNPIGVPVLEPGQGQHLPPSDPPQDQVHAASSSFTPFPVTNFLGGFMNT